MISARGLRKRYRDGEREVPVLEGADLEVRDGEFVAIVGASGSGKSTLLHLLGALDHAFEGELEVAGLKLAGLGDRDRSRFRNERVGFVFQSFHLVPELSAAENVRLPAFFSSLEEAEARARADEALGRVGLADKRDRPPTKLSGGERQRVAIARALLMRPRLLLCDEPTGNLDARTGDQIIALFHALNAQGLTVVAVTHEERLSRSASRVVRLEDGRLLDERREGPA